MAKQPKSKDCPQFTVLRPLLPPQARKPVWDTVNKLWPRYRDQLCEAAIDYIRYGRYRFFRDSLVMQRQFQKVVDIITAPLPPSLKLVFSLKAYQAF